VVCYSECNMEINKTAFSSTDIKLSSCETIIDEKKFLDAHTATVKRNEGNRYFEPYKERLNRYYEIRRNSKDS